MMAEGSLSFEPVFFDHGRWYEVDTLADLHEAERLFRDDFKSSNSQLAETRG